MDLDGLNEAQLAAVTAGPGYHLVIAGAGTGKTRTLVHRVAWLIEEGVPSDEIVLLTFTRRAAGEMLDRVAELVGGTARRVRGGTFHGFSNQILRKHGRRLGYTPRFTILDRGDAESLVGVVRSELGYGARGSGFAKRNTIQKVLSQSVNTGRTIFDLLDEHYPQYVDDAEAFERIAERYAERKLAQDVMDFDDLLVQAQRLLHQFPDVRDKVSGSARHVLVDEYQDTNRVQAKMAGLLSVAHGNLMVVGDEAQAIYGFRGAVVDNILNFPKIFADAQVTVLEQNYRSVQPILDLANGALDAATTGYEKRLYSELPGEARPVWVSVYDDHEQAETIIAQITALAEDGLDLRRQAVLFRSASHANMVEVALTEAGMPYRKFGGTKFTESSHIKDVRALLRVVANPRDVLGWMRVLQWFQGLGAKSAERIGVAVAALEVPRLDPEAYKRRKFYADLVELASTLEQASSMVADLPGLVLVLVEWYREKMRWLYEDWTRRAPDLDAFQLLAERYDDLETLLAQLSLDPVTTAEAEGRDHGDDWLTLSTIHSAKGLEWDAVYVLHMADGCFPSGYSLESAEQLEEERRLFYVAVTRAKQHLYLMAPRLLRAGWQRAAITRCSLLEEIADVGDLVDQASPTYGGGYQPPPPPAHAAADQRLQNMLDWYDDDF